MKNDYRRRVWLWLMILLTELISPLQKASGVGHYLRRMQKKTGRNNDIIIRSLLLNNGTSELPETTCVGPTLKAGKTLVNGQSICDNTVFDTGEMVYFGLVEGIPYVWSENYGPKELGHRDGGRVPSGRPATHVRLQLDGNLVLLDTDETDGSEKPIVSLGKGYFDGDARVKPGRATGELRFDGPHPNILKEVDSEGDIVFRLYELENDYPQREEYRGWKAGMVVASEPYPDIEESCVTALHAGERLTWKEFVCEFDSEGNRKYKFGLNAYGYLGLWLDDYNIRWRPASPPDVDPEYSRIKLSADYLHLQKSDGHLTYYLDTKPDVTVVWGSKCFDSTTEKLTLSDGDVNIFNEAGDVVWVLPASKIWGLWVADDREWSAVEPICHPKGNCS